MKNMNMNDIDILNNFAYNRNLNPSTKKNYQITIKQYTNYHQKTIQELFTEAEKEEETGIRWKNRTLKKRLMEFRIFLRNKYSKATADKYFRNILTLYNHYEIELHKLPLISDKNSKTFPQITFKDLPDKEIIKLALKIADPQMRTIILFISSSGCARKETLNLTIQDFIDATNDYHNSNNIYEIINFLKDNGEIIPSFKIKRDKTNKYYYSFCSPEATQEIITYLLGIKKNLKNEDKLFEIHEKYFIKKFGNINNALNLGKIGAHNRFRSHMLRKFHSSNLYNDGLSLDKIDALQGRSKNSVHNAYFLENPDELKKEYIKHMGAVTINLDVNNIDFKSPEFIELETEHKQVVEENQSIQEQMTNILEEFHEIKQRFK